MEKRSPSVSPGVSLRPQVTLTLPMDFVITSFPSSSAKQPTSLDTFLKVSLPVGLR